MLSILSQRCVANLPRRSLALSINGTSHSYRNDSVTLSHRRRSFASQPSQFQFPSESSPHEATILGFPSQNSLPPDLVHPFRKELIDIAGAISRFEPVRLYVRPEESNIARELLAAAANAGASGNINNNNITIIPFPVVHAWVRDTGPLFVFSKPAAGMNDKKHKSESNIPKRHAISFNFNEWGNKVPPETPRLTPSELSDNRLFAERIISSTPDPPNINPESFSSSSSTTPLIRTDFVLEGGAIELDGQGTCLLAESSVLNENRNPSSSSSSCSSSRQEKEKKIFPKLQQLLGCTKILSIPGLRGRDYVDCHIDTIARFVSPGVALVSVPHINSGKYWVDVADDAVQLLSRETDALGNKFRVEVLEEPDPVEVLSSMSMSMGGESEQMMMVGGGGVRETTTSYANYYVVNGGVIVPGYGDVGRDAKARELLGRLFPGREVVQVGIRTIAMCGGGVHCVTQQVPKVLEGMSTG